MNIKRKNVCKTDKYKKVIVHLYFNKFSIILITHEQIIIVQYKIGISLYDKFEVMLQYLKFN